MIISFTRGEMDKYYWGIKKKSAVQMHGEKDKMEAFNDTNSKT